MAGPFVEFQVTHFSLFAVVVSKQRKHVIRKIHRNIGGMKQALFSSKELLRSQVWF